MDVDQTKTPAREAGVVTGWFVGPTFRTDQDLTVRSATTPAATENIVPKAPTRVVLLHFEAPYSLTAIRQLGAY